MSLQAKFAALLGALGVVVVLALAVSAASLSFAHDEIRRPFQSMTAALSKLQQIKVAVEHQRYVLIRPAAAAQDPGDEPPTAGQRGLTAEIASLGLLHDREPTELDRAEFVVAGEQISRALGELRSDSWAETFTGKTSLTNFVRRIDEADAVGRRWLDDGAPTDRMAAAESLSGVFDLARRMESRIVADTEPLLLHTTDIRQWLFLLMTSVLVVTALACTLGLLLVRRWVVRPVAELRTATRRIAAGDFEHRIPVQGADELAALSTEVNSMASTVKTLQEEVVERERLAAVGEMVRRIAHNLRSPLAGIRGLAELTRTDLRSPRVAPDIREDLEENQSRIISAIDQFEQWLRQLLNATRPLEVQHETLDPRPWLERVVEAYRPTAQSRRVALELDAASAPPVAAFDPRQLEHAMGALIANALDAVSASPPPDRPGRVRVFCRVAGPEDGQAGNAWELGVEDNGPGIPPDLRDRIFKPYFTTKREGTGIGLALAQQVVRAHGGVLSLDDPPDMGGSRGDVAVMPRGTVFSARMPFGPIDSRSTQVATAGHSEVSSGQSSRHRG